MENLGKLLYRHFTLNQKTFFLYLLATGLTFFVLFFVQSWLKHIVDFKSMMHWYMPVFYIIGLVHSSQAFGDLSTPAKSYQYLLLPASHLEKFFSVWLVSSIFYVIAGYIVFILAAGFGGGLAALMFDYHINYNSIGEYRHFLLIGNFLVLQTIFFLGGITFKNWAFIKTILALVIFHIALSIIAGIIARFVLGSFIWDIGPYSGNEENFAAIERIFTEYIPTIAKVLYWGIIGPFFLIVSYFKLKESEV